MAGAADLIVLAERHMNTGSGVAVYSAYAGNWDGAFIEERSEIRTRLEAEMAAAIKPR